MRRTLPYQGPDNYDPATLRSERLKRWTVGMGKRERDRVRALQTYASTVETQPQEWKDEIVAERGVLLLPERGGEPYFNMSYKWHRGADSDPRTSGQSSTVTSFIHDPCTNIPAYFGPGQPDFSST